MRNHGSKFYLLTIPGLMMLGGTQSPDNRPVQPQLLTGNITLTLSRAVWKDWQNQPVYQNLILDLICKNSQCQSQVWGYAPKYNKEVDHRGSATVTTRPDTWQINAKLNIQPHPWNENLEPANYQIEIIPYKNRLLGSYRGEMKGKSLKGKVTGTINPFWPVNLENYRKLEDQEHPRLIFRRSQLKQLREKAGTPEGKIIIEQLSASLKTPVYYDGYAPNGGYHAAGHCFLALIKEQPGSARQAWQIVEKSRQNRGARHLEQSTIVAGIALAYDLCYPYWSSSQRQEISRWLYGEGKNLLRGDSPGRGWNGNAWSNWNARARGAAGLAALAILDDPIDKNEGVYTPRYQVQIARRNIQRYIVSALGDQGFGIEGDHYTTEPMILSVVPFLIAYRNVIGEDLVAGSNIARLIPQYYTRMIAGPREFFIPAYGRHRRYGGKSLFAMSLAITPPAYLPKVLSALDTVKGGMFDPYFPHIAPYIFAFERTGVKSAPSPDRVLVDEQRGLYVFRDRWRDERDFIASIYLKRELLKASWSFPDVGSFRIWGLNGHWAAPGASKTVLEEENTILIPNISPWQRGRPTSFGSRVDGSGIVTLRSRSSNITWSRSFAVDYSKSSGAAGLFVVVDKLSTPGPSTWIMNTEGDVRIDPRGFTITQGGNNLQATFINPVRLSYEKTGTGGRIRARGEDIYYVVMTVQEGRAPKVTVAGEGLEARVKVNRQEVSFPGDKIKLKIF